jgi:hypothetical protein
VKSIKISFSNILLLLITALACLPFLYFLIILIFAMLAFANILLHNPFLSSDLISILTSPWLPLVELFFLILAVFITIKKKSISNIKTLKVSLFFAIIASLPVLYYLLFLLINFLNPQFSAGQTRDISDFLFGMISLFGGFIVSPTSILISIYFGIVSIYFSRKSKKRLNKILMIFILILLLASTYWAWLVYHIY